MQRTANSAFSTGILDALSDAIVWMRPVFTPQGAVEDFEVGYCNKAADEAVNHPHGSITGLCILKDGVPSRESAEANFRHYLNVYESGEILEYTFFAHHSSRLVETVRRPYEGGVLSTTKDRSAQREAERKEKVTKRTLQSIVDNSSNGIVLFDAVRDETGGIKDFQVRSYNEQRNKLLGLTEEEGTTLTFRQILQVLGAESFFHNYVDLVENGKSIQREQYVERSKTWLSISAVKVEDGFLAMLTDITKLKESQQLLRQQSQYLTSILNTSLNAVVTMEAIRNTEGKIIDFCYRQVNKRFLEWLSKSEEEVVGGTMLTLFPNTVETGIFDVYRKALETGTRQHTEVRYSDGGFEVWYDLSVGILDENTAVGTFNDITQRKKALKLITEQKVLLDNLLRYSPSGITIIEAVRDGKGKVVDFRHILVNDQAEKFIGFSKEDLLTKTNRELDPGFAQSKLLKELAATLQTGETTFSDYKIPTGQWIEGAASKMDENRLICVINDVTTFRESQEKMVSLVQELQRSNQSLEEFAYAASHDLQEPLRKIYTFSDRLRNELSEHLSNVQQLMFERIASATSRMKNLIEDLLAYSQVSKGSSVFERVDLSSVAEAALQNLEAGIQETGALITVEKLPVISGDEFQLQQLFQNLIGNAVKYRKPTIAPDVKITCNLVQGKSTGIPALLEQAEKEFYQITVSDNGIGFEQQYAQSIFQVFNRLHGRAEYSGTGIGLAIVQRAVQNHSGYITAEGRPGIGATFRVFLPVSNDTSL